MTGNVALDIRVSGYTGADIEIYKLVISNCEELIQEYTKEYDNITCAQDCDLCGYSQDDYAACPKMYWLDRITEKMGIIRQAEDAITALEELIQGQVVE